MADEELKNLKLKLLRNNNFMALDSIIQFEKGKCQFCGLLGIIQEKDKEGEFPLWELVE